jgi:prolyl-tRNA editing enzyme YbaK/EbsC (Cys-tRNA(Pro) deacylase)
MTVAKLEAFLNQHAISHELKQFPMSVATVEMAAGAVHAKLDQMVKTVVMIDKKNDLWVAIIRGDDRVSLSRFGFELKLDGLRMAKQDEVLARTGFAVGGVPPLGFDARWVMDVKVKEMPHCWGGGGSDKALLKVTPTDILKATNATVARVTV